MFKLLDLFKSQERKIALVKFACAILKSTIEDPALDAMAVANEISDVLKVAKLKAGGTLSKENEESSVDILFDDTAV